MGLGRILFDKMIGYLRSRGTREAVGETLRVNHRMLKLARKLGFETEYMDDGETVGLRLQLDGHGPG
mgnify:FL=1